MTFFFTLVFMFLVYWRPQDWLFPQLYGVPLLDVITGVALLAMIIEMDVGRIKFPKGLPQVYLLGGLWLASILSHVAHGYFGGVVATIPEVLKICFFALLLLCVLDSPKRLRWVVRLLVVMSLFMAVHGMLQADGGYGFGPVRPYFVKARGDTPAYFRTQFYGIFNDSNDMAQVLATSVPLSFVVVRRGRFLSFLVGVCCSIVLYLGIRTTHSDGGMVALAAGGGVMLITLMPARWVPRLLFLGVLGGLAATPFAGPMFDVSAHDRVLVWGVANEAFKSNLIFGTGYNMFWVAAGSSAPHNAFVECYTELGVFGYWFWFSLLLLGVMGCWRGRAVLAEHRDTVELNWLFRFSGMAMAAMVGMCASSYFLTRAFHFPTFFLIAMLGAVPRTVERYVPESAPLLTLDRRMFLFLTATVFGSLFYIYMSIIIFNKLWYG